MRFGISGKDILLYSRCCTSLSRVSHIKVILILVIKFEWAMWMDLRPDYPRLRLVLQVEKINK